MIFDICFLNLKIDQIGTEEKLEGRVIRFSLLIRPEDQETYILRGRIAAVFEVDTTGSKVEKSSLKKIAEDIFLQHFFVKDFVSTEGVFKESLDRIREHFKGLNVQSVSFSAVAILHDLIYLARVGDCGLAYFRSGNFLEIKGLTNDTQKLQSFSGRVLGGDVLVLTASILERDNFLNDFLKRLQNLDPTKTVAVFLYFEEGAPMLTPTPLSNGNNKSNPQGKLLSKIDIWKQSRSRSVYIKQGSSLHKKSSRLSKILSMIFLLGFIVSVVYTIYKSRLDKRSALLGAVLGENTQKISEAEGIIGLNNEKARQSLKEVLDSLEESKKIATKERSADLDILIAQVKNLLDKANNVVKVGEDKLYYDVTFKDASALGHKLCVSGDNLILLQQSGKLLFLNKKDGEMTVNEFNEKIYPTLPTISCENDSVFLAGESFVDKIVFGEETTLTSDILDADNTFSGFADFVPYGGNLYFLKPSSNEILKYQSSANGFGKSANYLEEGESVQDTLSLAIDGNIYANTTATIKRYQAGSEVFWELKNLPEGSTDFSTIYTDSDVNDVFVLNKALGQIWVFNKDGFYLRQIRLDSGSSISDFALGSGYIYLLSGSKIYSLQL